MKKIFTLVLVIIAATTTFANPVNSVVADGNWISNATWSLNRQPIDGDTIVIPAGKTVTIDANLVNTANFYFIKIWGVLQFGSSGKIDMSGDSRVYVFSGGSITGTSASQVLRINGTDKFKGTEGSVTGSKFATSATAASPNGFVTDVALPVKFIAFSVAHENNNVLVQWTTAGEINNNYFEVQRSENGNDWVTAVRVTAAGNTAATNSYSYTDKNITSKIVYYRIRQVDIDGTTALTPVRMIKNEVDGAEVRITAASSNSIYVHFFEQVKANVVIRLSTSNGQVISQKTFDSPIGQVMVPVQNSNKGIYIVTVTDGEDLKFSKEVLL